MKAMILLLMLQMSSALDLGRVNIRTLNFFLNSKHMELPCFVSMEIAAAYNSYSNESSMFGNKWTFSHNIRVKKGRTSFDIIEGDGFRNPYTRERTLEEAKKNVTEAIIVAQKKEDVKKGGLKQESIYKELRERLLKDEKYREELEEKLLPTNRVLPPGTYYSFARGPSTLELKADGTFVRRFQNGAFETFNAQGLVTKLADRHGNFIEYVYQGDLLTRMNDMCGRSLVFTYQKDPALRGLIASIKDSLNRETSYTFYPNRNLRTYTNTSGERTEYTYDKNGYLISMSLFIGKDPKPIQRIEISYNADLEVQSEKGPGDRETRYKRSFIAENRNHSTTEVQRFTGGKLASREVHEFKIKEFEVVSKFDPLGKEMSREMKKFSAITGYPVSILNQNGEGELYDYDGATGALRKRTLVPSGEVTEFAYDARCDNQVNMMTSSRPTDPFVRRIFFIFDQKCNLSEASELRGPANLISQLKPQALSKVPPEIKRNINLKLEYNNKGKIAFLRDLAKDQHIAFTYWQFGKPESITLRDVGTLFVKYRPTGEIEKVDTFPHGKGKERFKGKDATAVQGEILTEVKSSLDGMLNFLKPTGVNIGL